MKKIIALLSALLAFAGAGCILAAEVPTPAPAEDNLLQWLELGTVACSTGAAASQEDPRGDSRPEWCTDTCSGMGCGPGSTSTDWYHCLNCVCAFTDDPCPQPRWVC